MQDLLALRCGNCGTPLEWPGAGVPGVICPVCQLFNPLDTIAPSPRMTIESFEIRLSELVAQARASQITPDDIVVVLRNELEFAAELASSGRDLCVQIIDLGPRIGQPLRRVSRIDSMFLRGRSVGS